MGESRGVLCTSCRKLISSEEQRCPHCGARRPAALSGLRSWSNASPAQVIQVVVNLSVVLYAVTLIADPSQIFNVDLRSIWGLLGIGSPSTRGLYLMGMTGGLAWICGHWWTLLTATFLHGSLLHIFFNLYWLRLLGPVLVAEQGIARFVIVYMLTGVSGFALSNFWSGSPTIGASCSVFGLMGALIVYGRKRGGRFGDGLSQQVTAWAIATFLISFMIPHVNNAGHVGGFLGGLALGGLMAARPRPPGRPLVLLAIALVVATAVSFGLAGWHMWMPYQTGLAVCS